jgi:type IV pilus assembly protein PilN
VININLLPSAQRRPAVVFDSTMRLLVTILAVVLGFVIIGTIWQTILINRYNAQISMWNDKIAAEQQQVKEVDDLRDQVASLKAKAELLERIKQSPLQLAEVLNDLGDVSPQGVWYTSVALNHTTSQTSVAGRTTTLREVADLMLNIDSSPIFGNASLTSSTQPGNVNGQAAPPGSVTFTVIGYLSTAVVGQ